MSTLPCRWMPPHWDDVRPFAAILGHNPQPLSESCHHEAALVAERSAFWRVTKKQIPRGPKVPLVMTIPDEIAAESGISEPIHVIKRFVSGHGFSRAARSLTRNGTSAPGQTGAEAQTLCRRLIGTTKGRALIQSKASRLTSYSAIFCRPVFANQQFADCPRKIFKTDTLKVNHFNILQIYVCNLLKPEILIFYFFLR
jgi:hypothetical protein